jgi:peptidoglycan/xylan/chitin deacetylase (PgdA/CDA1 family)
MTATVYVVSGLVRDPAASSDEGNKLYGGRPMLTPADLRDLHAAGIEIASHGHTHRLAADVAAASPDDYLDDVAASRSALSAWIGAPVESYAYPNGQRGAFSDLTRNLLVKAGYTTAATTVWGAPGPDADLLALPRCEMRHDDTLADVIAKLRGHRDHRRLVQLARQGSRSW